jgi:hypothetical protein
MIGFLRIERAPRNVRHESFHHRILEILIQTMAFILQITTHTPNSSAQPAQCHEKHPIQVQQRVFLRCRITM